MDFWRRLFGRSRNLLQEQTGRVDANGLERVSCMDVVHTIRKRLEGFNGSQGMVVVLLEGLRVQIYFFDGIARASWGYNNQEFNTDDVGQTFLAGAPKVLALTTNSGSLLPGVLQREFLHCDMSIGKLWKLDPAAWDYETMKVLHGEDVGIRISFDQIPERDASQ